MLLDFDLFDRVRPTIMTEEHIREMGQSDTADETKRTVGTHYDSVVTDFDVVRDPSSKPKRNPRGQTRRLTLRVFIRICHLVEQGWAITRACESESVTYSLFRLRCTENPRLEQRIKEAEAVRFQRRHEEALEAVIRAGQKSWMAYAWFLERSLPNLYALKNVNRSEGSADQPILDRISPEDLARDAALALEVARQTLQPSQDELATNLNLLT